MTKVYIASKMHHAEKWRALYSRHKDLHMVSRWPFLESVIYPSPAAAVKFWQDDIADIERCDFVLVYAEEGEHLRGALVEAGVGLALGKYVIVVGDHPDYGTWRYHPKVINLRTLDEALLFLINNSRREV